MAAIILPSRLREGLGVGLSAAALLYPDNPHPNPSPEGEGLPPRSPASGEGQPVAP